MPAAPRCWSIASLEGASTAAIQTLKPTKPDRGPRVCRASLVTRTYMVGRLPTVTGCPARPSAATVCVDGGARAIFERRPRRSSRPAAQARLERCARPRAPRTPVGIRRLRHRASEISATGLPPTAVSCQPGRTPAVAAPTAGFDAGDEHVAADEPDVEARRAPTGGRLARRVGGRRAGSRSATARAAPSMRAMTARNSAGGRGGGRLAAGTPPAPRPSRPR